ncbi:MAG: 7-carboxy-7-deazaguanine synthase QueE [Syntrophomonas sp.]|nr:7-carboxy-7-deazaguanine synthase QueE [Syntrophomonas sp.]
MKANLSEIMESIQGEGLLAGSRQVFLRFTGCNLRCEYCDTPASYEPLPWCQVAEETGKGDLWSQIQNPLSVQQIGSLIKKYSSQWISLTGGEPLLWPDFIKELGDYLKPQGYLLLLETNGTLFQQLEQCLSCLDMISMDYKLPSTAGADYARLHAQFLSVAAAKPIYIKMVIDSQIKRAELESALETITDIKPDITLILQPVTPRGNAAAPSMEQLLDFQQLCQRKIADVRIIPQIHKLMGLI